MADAIDDYITFTMKHFESCLELHMYTNVLKRNIANSQMLLH